LDELQVDIGSARIFVRAWGDRSGRPVLCWHGVGLASPGGLAFEQPAPSLAAHGLRILALDAPGFGASPPLEQRAYHPHALADLVPPLLDRLGLDRVAFMGFSWGGDVGCHLGARHPERLTALVVLDAGYIDPPFDPTLEYEVYVERWERTAREARARGRTLMLAPSIVAAVAHGMAQALPSTTRAGLAASGLPVLVIAAGHASDEDLDAFGADVPQAEIRRVEGAGHDVLGEGGPNVVHAIGQWLVNQASQ
jgi:pimeloyl-ACP methyl ester carboxylesterase